MKKVRAYIIVDLQVADNLTEKEIAEIIGVGKYLQNLLNQEDVILLRDKDFEVLDYINIEVIDHKNIEHIKD